MKNRDDLRILLLQIREDEETMLEEFYEFVQFSGLHETQIIKLNTYQKADFGAEAIEGFDALFVGGSSDATVRDEVEYHFVKSCRRLIRYCYEQNIPVFASCFGFQVAVKELGGEVILDKANMEMGQHQISLTPDAKNDPLLHDYPERFWVISGHKERAATIPAGTVLLGYSDRCPYHLIRFGDKPFYASQFHPEVDTKDLIARITRYQNRYLDDASALETIKQQATEETTIANSLIKAFIDRIVLATP